MRGHWLPPNWRVEWVQPGPMARCVADLHLALRVLNASVDKEPVSGARLPPLGEPANVSLNALRIGTYADDGIFRPSPAVRRAVEEAGTALRQSGAQVEEFRPPDVLEAERIYFGLFYSDGLDALRHMTAHGRRDWRIRRLFLFARLPGVIRPVLGKLSGVLGRRYESLLYGWVSKRRRSPAECETLVQEEAAYRRRFLSQLDAQRLDALICPAFGLPALPHGTFYGAAAGSYALLYNLLGMPAGVVAVTCVRRGEESDRQASNDPVERSAIRVETGSAGLPIGVQVVARHWREDVVLAVMAALEREFRDRPDYPASLLNRHRRCA